MSVWSVDPAAEAIGEMSQRKRIADMQFDLQIRLSPIGGEGSLAYDEAHNVANVELTHGGEDNELFRSGTEARGTSL